MSKHALHLEVVIQEELAESSTDVVEHAAIADMHRENQATFLYMPPQPLVVFLCRPEGACPPWSQYVFGYFSF